MNVMDDLNDESISELEAAGWNVSISEDENGEKHIALSFGSGNNLHFNGNDDNAQFGQDDDLSPATPENLPEQLQQLGALSRFVNEMANRLPWQHQPFVGMNAFAHKGGIHVSAIRKA